MSLRGRSPVAFTLASVGTGTHQGFLLRKEEGLFGEWFKKRWVILKDRQIFFFESRVPESVVKTTLQLEGYIVEVVDDQKLTLKLINQECLAIFKLTHPRKGQEWLCAATEEDLQEWIQSILLESSREPVRMSSILEFGPLDESELLFNLPPIPQRPATIEEEEEENEEQSASSSDLSASSSSVSSKTNVFERPKLASNGSDETIPPPKPPRSIGTLTARTMSAPVVIAPQTTADTSVSASPSSSSSSLPSSSARALPATPVSTSSTSSPRPTSPSLPPARAISPSPESNNASAPRPSLLQVTAKSNSASNLKPSGLDNRPASFSSITQNQQSPKATSELPKTDTSKTNVATTKFEPAKASSLKPPEASPEPERPLSPSPEASRRVNKLNVASIYNPVPSTATAVPETKPASAPRAFSPALVSTATLESKSSLQSQSNPNISIKIEPAVVVVPPVVEPAKAEPDNSLKTADRKIGIASRVSAYTSAVQSKPDAELPKPEPVKAEPVKVEPPKPEPVKVEPPKPEPVKAEPPKPEPVKVESPKPAPVKVEPPKAEPAQKEPRKFLSMGEQNQAEPAKVEPAKVEPVKVEPAKVEPAKAPAKVEPAKVEPVKTEPAKVDAKAKASLKVEPTKAPAPVKVEPVKVEPAKVEPAKQIKPEPVKAEPVKAEPVKAEPVKAEPVQTEPQKFLLMEAQKTDSVSKTPVQQTSKTDSKPNKFLSMVAETKPEPVKISEPEKPNENQSTTAAAVKQEDRPLPKSTLGLLGATGGSRSSVIPPAATQTLSTPAPQQQQRSSVAQTSRDGAGRIVVTTNRANNNSSNAAKSSAAASSSAFSSTVASVQAATVDWINSQLANEKVLKDFGHVPVTSDSLGSACRDGTLLCYLVNTAVANTLDTRTINTTGLNDEGKRLENVTLCINSARAIGCTISTPAADVTSGKAGAAEAIAWQLVRANLRQRMKVFYTSESDNDPPNCVFCNRPANDQYSQLKVAVGPAHPAYCMACVNDPAKLLSLFSGSKGVSSSSTTARNAHAVSSSSAPAPSPSSLSSPATAAPSTPTSNKSTSAPLSKPVSESDLVSENAPAPVQALSKTVADIDRRYNTLSDDEISGPQGKTLMTDMKNLMSELQTVSQKHSLYCLDLVAKYNELTRLIPARINQVNQKKQLTSKSSGPTIVAAGGSHCPKCNKALQGDVVEVFGSVYHSACFGCFQCGKALTSSCLNIENRPYCDRCGKKAFIQSRLAHRAATKGDA